MVKMLRLGKAAGPCALCGATGLIAIWDREGEYEPCQSCRGTGHSASNMIVIERETKKTKFLKRCELLSDALLTYTLSSYNDAVILHDWIDEYCDPLVYDEDVTPGLYLARMFIHDQAKRSSAEEFVNRAFENLLEHYNWLHDMGFNSIDEIAEGGQYWSEADPGNV